MTCIFDIAKDAACLSDMTQKKAVELTREVVDVMKSLLCDGVEVSIPSIGKFKTVSRAARKGRNPSTGDVIDIPAKDVVVFKRSSKL